MLRDFFLGFVKIHILHHAAQEAVYGAALIEELRRHGYELSPGTLYPILHSMEGAGYLEREERTVGGKVRKYYMATDEGRAVLAETRGKIAELVDEVIEGGGPASISELPGGSEDIAVSTISPDGLSAQQARHQRTLVIDVRGPDEFAAGHVPGALNRTVDELTISLEEIPADRPVVVYCNLHHPGAARSERAAGVLRARGRDAQVLEGGFPAWLAAGHDVEHGFK